MLTARVTPRSTRPTRRPAGVSSLDTIGSSILSSASFRKQSSTSCRRSRRIEHDPIEAAERIIAGMPNPPEIQYAGSKAFYSPITDRITLPPRELFVSAEEHFATLAHEAAHAVGHPKRLNRNSIGEAAPFGSPTYSFEELVAEFSAAYLCAEAGISPAVLNNQAAYIQGWVAKLHSDKRMVVIAAAAAQKAADYILNRESAAE